MRKMKRKVARLSGFRLSPNEEALLIKEEHERRRRLRIKQVREQERFIAEQIREKVKQCRNQQLEQLANELKAEWQLAQGEKTKSLEKLYLSSLKAVGKGHRQAQENEPDLKIQSRLAAVNREKAEKRHREALRELKQQREKEHEAQTRYIKTRKKALLIEKKRAITIAHLPPPPPNPFADLDVPKYPTVKMYDIDGFSATHYHLPEPCVNREINANQVSARLTAEKEEKRLEELKQEAEMERQEQLEKARLRGSHALQLVHLIQDRERLMKELEQMQLADLTRRRQAVSQMPQQLFEPPYRRMEVKEDRQKEMEIAFEDMYADDKKIKGDVVLRLEPEPLPAPSVETQDEDLDLSVEPEGFQEEQCAKGGQEESEIQHFRKPEVPPLIVTDQSSTSPSKAALMKLLTKIRKQKDYCTTRSESSSVNKNVTIESGCITSEETNQRTLTTSTTNTNVSEEHPEMHSVLTHNNKYQRETSEETIVAGNMTLFHPKEQANRIRSDVDRMKQLHNLEQQKQQQLDILWQSEQQKQNLEANLRKAQLQQQQGETQVQERLISDLEKQTSQEHEQLKHSKIFVSNEVSPEDEYMLHHHQYQRHLVEQNRLHKAPVEETRKQLEEYLLEKGLPSVSTSARCLSGQDIVCQNCHNEPRGHLNVNQSPLDVHSGSRSQPDFPRSERHGFEVNGLEVLEPCIRTSDAVEPYQVPSQVHLMENQSKSIQTQPGTAEIAKERLKQSMFSIPLTKPVEILKNQEIISASSVDISLQQEHLKGLQQQLWRQREDLLATQRLQEEFICRHQNQLREQMQQQQQHQALEKNRIENQSGHLALHKVMPASENVEQLTFIPYLLRSSEDFHTGSTDKNFHLNNEELHKGPVPSVQINEALLLPWYYDFKTGQAGSHSAECPNVTTEARHYRPSKPPVTKTKLGLCGLIEQHELSSIQEVESPKSDRLSMFVNRMTSSNNCYKSEARELISSRMDSSYSSEVMELDLSNVSTDSSQQSSSVPKSTVESIQTGRLTWREKLKLETGSLPVQASLSKSPSYSDKVERGGLEYSDPASLPYNITDMIFPHYSTYDVHSFNAIEKTCEVDQVSSTTLSTGSFPLSEQTAPVLINSAGDDQCTIHNIPSRQSTPTSTVCKSNLPSSFSEYQDTMKAQNNLSTSNEEKCTSNENKIQKLIEKYTQDLNKLLDSGGKRQDSATGCDILDLEFPNLFLQLQNCQQDSNFELQPLECRPDFSISSSSLSPTSSKNSNFPRIGNTLGNQHSTPATSSEMQSPTDNIVSTPDSGRTASDVDQVEEHIQHSYNEENDGLESFQPVHLEITSRQYSSSVDQSENLEQEFHNETSINNKYIPPSDLLRIENVGADSLTVDSMNQSSYSEPAIEKLRTDDGGNSQEHAGPFFQLNGTLTTVSEFKIPNQNGKSLEGYESKTQVVTFIKTINSNDEATLDSLSFEASKLMLSEEDNCISNEVHQITEQDPMMQPKWSPHTKVGTDAILEHECELEAQRDQSQPSNFMPGDCLLGTVMPSGAENGAKSSLIRTLQQGTESDVGIMEEPELTQLTLNDSTLLDDELGQEFPVDENELNEIQAFSQANEVQPVIPENTVSDSQKSEVMIIEFEPSAKILNEAVLKRRQKFLTNAAKRVEDLKRREKSEIVKSELYTRPIHLEQRQTSVFAASSSSGATQLKMVGEVKVSTPEDRKAVEVGMQQRTLRLYNQLEEVKNKKREVNRKTVCARNREKAKEFQKKTLEKLRANKVCK
ncbi:centrosomal protein of 295 kDa isoform X3 [Pristis pectinata]|uniref:centrosomal protein of 295 kDa isoform X3 n=1 Tax=Pristis pectinata TaxID=685728 RepID=UPI00223DBD01|nr:centrosomal protein of 295 kDa isoform X3 [Pristis pectinata]